MTARLGQVLDGVVLTGGTVIDPADGNESRADVLISGGKIEGIAPGISLDGRTAVDVGGLMIMPGLVDLHAHLREPGQEWKEDIESGSAAAAAGGFTTVCAMPNTSPPLDDEQAVRYVIERGREVGLVDVRPIGAISKHRAGKELAPIGELVAAGCIGISDDGSPVMSSELMRSALRYAGMFNVPVISHCEDRDLTEGGQINLGFVSSRLGLRGMPAEAEEIMVARDLLLARLTRAHVHIAHVSTAGSVELIRQAKLNGVLVTAEVTPHHLALTEEMVAEHPYDTSTKVNPPLRTSADVEALIDGLRDGTIDAIATDHAPHHIDDKKVEYAVSEFGISGLETAWPVIYTTLVQTGRLSAAAAAAPMSVNPARIAGLDAGRLAPGTQASLCVFDPETRHRCDPGLFLSKGKNTPFAGMELTGWIVATISRGRLVAGTGRLAALEAAAGWS